MKGKQGTMREVNKTDDEERAIEKRKYKEAKVQFTIKM